MGSMRELQKRIWVECFGWDCRCLLAERGLQWTQWRKVLDQSSIVFDFYGHFIPYKEVFKSCFIYENNQNFVNYCCVIILVKFYRNRIENVDG